MAPAVRRKADESADRRTRMFTAGSTVGRGAGSMSGPEGGSIGGGPAAKQQRFVEREGERDRASREAAQRYWITRTASTLAEQ